MRLSLFSCAAFALALALVASTGAVFGQVKGSGPCINHFGQREWALLLETVPPQSKKTLIENPEVRRQQSDNLKQLFAFACDAVKRGVAHEKTNAVELKSIRSETIAVAYDREVTKQKDGAAFSRITAAQVEKFYASPRNVTEFGEFLDAKIAILKRADPATADRDPTEGEKQEARKLFAKIKISEGQYLRNPALKAQFRAGVELQSRLQQAQFLTRILIETDIEQITVSDTEIDKYIIEHSELDTSKQRALATKLLERAKAGEDFAGLANQHSEDPGNNGTDGAKQGGLYSGVKKGVFVAPFEQAALSLKPGDLYQSLVETDFGYHILKLEKLAGAGDEMTYDVRHILISTGIKDPTNPTGRDTPVREYAKTMLATEKETVMGQRIQAANPVVVEDFQPTAPPKKRVVRKRR